MELAARLEKQIPAFGTMSEAARHKFLAEAQTLPHPSRAMIAAMIASITPGNTKKRPGDISVAEAAAMLNATPASTCGARSVYLNGTPQEASAIIHGKLAIFPTLKQIRAGQSVEERQLARRIRINDHRAPRMTSMGIAAYQRMAAEGPAKIAKRKIAKPAEDFAPLARRFIAVAKTVTPHKAAHELSADQMQEVDATIRWLLRVKDEMQRMGGGAEIVVLADRSATP